MGTGELARAQFTSCPCRCLGCFHLGGSVRNRDAHGTQQAHFFTLDWLGGEKVKYAPVFGQQRMNEVENG
jgi:hypothetical protein